MQTNEGSVGSAATAVTGTTVPVVEKKSKRSRSFLNQTHLRSLMKAEDVVRSALDEQYATALSNREITRDFVTGLSTDVDSARDLASQIVQHKTAAKSAVADQSKAEKVLQRALQEVQKAAKQKYARTNRVALNDFFVGQKLNGSIPNLAQTSQTVLRKLDEAGLPGFNETKIAAIGTMRQTWLNAKASQTDSTAAAQTARAELKTLLKSIEDRRVTIQLAADAEWSHADEANAGVRKEFGLSSRRALNV